MAGVDNLWFNLDRHCLNSFQSFLEVGVKPLVREIEETEARVSKNFLRPSGIGLFALDSLHIIDTAIRPVANNTNMDVHPLIHVSCDGTSASQYFVVHVGRYYKNTHFSTQIRR